MQFSRKLSKILSLVVLLLLLAACGQDISYNADGSLKLETVLGQNAVMDMVDVALADTAIEVDELRLRHGFVQLHGECADDTGTIHPVDVRLEFDAIDGSLVTHITEATVYDAPVDTTVIATWNEAIAARRAENGAEDSGRELEYVTVTPEEVCLTWRVERTPAVEK